MGKNRQDPGSTTTPSDSSTTADGQQTSDATQQQQQPAPTGGSFDAPIGDEAVNNPNIINR